MRMIGTALGYVLSWVLSVAFAALLVAPLLALEIVRLVAPVREPRGAAR